MNSKMPWLNGLLAAGFFGISMPLAKLFTDVNPAMLAGLLYLGSGCGLLLWKIVVMANSKSGLRLPKQDLPWLTGSIFFGGILAPLLLMFGLQRTTASSASLLLNLEGVLTAVIAWICFKEHADKRIILGMLLITFGGVILSSGSLDSQTFLGNVLIAAACFAWSIDNNFTRNITSSDPVHIACVKGLFSGITNVFLSFAIGGVIPEESTMCKLLAIGFLCYGLSLVLYIRSLHLVGTARSAAYFSIAPFVGATLSIIFLREPVSANLMFAGLMMIVGVVLHVSEKHDHVHTHAAEVHDHVHFHDEHHTHEHDVDAPEGEPHSHLHVHTELKHSHPHYPDSQHRHEH